MNTTFALGRSHPVGQASRLSPFSSRSAAVSSSTNCSQRGLPGSSGDSAETARVMGTRGSEVRDRRDACPTVSAFTLIELMVAMLLLSVIIIGLVAMFGQTQHAFRVGMAQTDITEAGRSVMNMVARELAEAVPSRLSASNFIIYNPPIAPLWQELPGSTNATPLKRKYALQELLFLTKQNKQWNAVGYRIGGSDAGFGTLYRFETNFPPYLLGTAPTRFANLALTNFSRVADGIIHFRVRPLDTNGFVIPAPLPIITNQQVFAYVAAVTGEVDYYFASNALPYAIGLEIGVLPPRLVDRLRALPDAATRRTYLTKSAQSGAVEMYQQRITLPNGDPTVIP
jgi:type II secretory pathway pseudopilin PulG